MPKGISDKPVFKEYNQKQIELLPKTADELIPQNHLVRLVDNTIGKMDLEPLLKQYKGWRSQQVFTFNDVEGICIRLLCRGVFKP
jgi:transposase